MSLGIERIDEGVERIGEGTVKQNGIKVQEDIKDVSVEFMKKLIKDLVKLVDVEVNA